MVWARRYKPHGLLTFCQCTEGIPKFFRWLSERYPLTNQPCASTNMPEFDNLYLDMNGIIHNCTHGNNPNVHLTEEEMVLKVFVYIDHLFKIIQPQKLLFAAIDGKSTSPCPVISCGFFFCARTALERKICLQQGLPNGWLL